MVSPSKKLYQAIETYTIRRIFVSEFKHLFFSFSFILISMYTNLFFCYSWRLSYHFTSLAFGIVIFYQESLLNISRCFNGSQSDVKARLQARMIQFICWYQVFYFELYVHSFNKTTIHVISCSHSPCCCSHSVHTLKLFHCSKETFTGFIVILKATPIYSNSKNCLN